MPGNAYEVDGDYEGKGDDPYAAVEGGALLRTLAEGEAAKRGLLAQQELGARQRLRAELPAATEAKLRELWAALLAAEVSERAEHAAAEEKGLAALRRAERDIHMAQEQERQDAADGAKPAAKSPPTGPAAAERAELRQRCLAQRERLTDLERQLGGDLSPPESPDASDLTLGSWDGCKALNSIAGLEAQLQEAEKVLEHLQSIANAAGLKLAVKPPTPRVAEPEPPPPRTPSSCESQDLAEAAQPQASPRCIPALRAAVPGIREPAGKPVAVPPIVEPVKDSVSMEQVRQERAQRFNKQFTRAASYNDVDALAALQAQQQQGQAGGYGRTLTEPPTAGQKRRTDSCDSTDLAKARPVPKSPRGMPGINLAKVGGPGLAAVATADADRKEVLRQEQMSRYSRNMARAQSYNDVNTLSALLQQQEQQQQNQCHPTQSAPLHAGAAAPPPVTPRRPAADGGGGGGGAPATKASSSSGGDSPAGKRDSCDSQDLAEARAPQPSPRGMPTLPIAPANTAPVGLGGSRPPAINAGGNLGVPGPYSPYSQVDTSSPSPSPSPKQQLTAEELQQLRDGDRNYTEILRQERALRRNKYLARAASYDDVGKLADLIPQIDIKAIGALMSSMPVECASPTTGLIQDAMLKEQLKMDGMGRYHRHMAKSASMMELGKISKDLSALLGPQAIMPKLNPHPHGFDPRTPTRGGDDEWSDQILQEQASRRRASGSGPVGQGVPSKGLDGEPLGPQASAVTVMRVTTERTDIPPPGEQSPGAAARKLPPLPKSPQLTAQASDGTSAVVLETPAADSPRPVVAGASAPATLNAGSCDAHCSPRTPRGERGPVAG